jgi:hypothetical protein
MPKRPRRTTKMTRKASQQDVGKGDTSQVGEERVHGTMSGVQPSQMKRKTTQVEEMHKKRKYTMKEPVITLIEDDAKFIVDKVQYRGE